MNLSATRPATFSTLKKLKKVSFSSNLVFGSVVVLALIAFEIFNFSTTDFALKDLLGDLRFFDFRWSTILALAFCGIDFAGIARIFTGGASQKETPETWYLFGAWLLAATMNALLTWWGISMAMTNHVLKSTSVVSSSMLTNIVPVFIAIMVWVIRILIIGSFSQASKKSQSSLGKPAFNTQSRYNTSARNIDYRSMPIHTAGMSARRGHSNGNIPASMNSSINHAPNAEPSYHSLSAEAAPKSRGSRYL